MSSPRVFYKDVFSRISPEKRQRVLQAAAAEFAEKGLNLANINVIAERAGISVGSLYKYFESKTHLYLEVVNRGLPLLEEALDPIVNSSLSLEEKVDSLVAAVFDGVRAYPVMNRLYHRFTAEGDSELAEKLSSSLESVTANAYTALMRQAKEDGVLSHDCDEAILAFGMDNILLCIQFSLSSEYWKDRMRIYLGADILERESDLKKQMSRFIKGALGLRL
ncbi:MAG: TetR/AcrR family transcriptional regulator [Spirochaetales bacterium]|nr:TetR/AcrR family transcriptional regulator [Spirochaetales bacterium]